MLTFCSRTASLVRFYPSTVVIPTDFAISDLCVIAQNAEISKMNVRNLGIVFSPTLAIPAPLFTLLLAEFDVSPL